MGLTRMTETQGTCASGQWSLAHSVHLLGQTGRRLAVLKGSVLLMLEVLPGKVGGGVGRKPGTGPLSAPWGIGAAVGPGCPP